MKQRYILALVFLWGVAAALAQWPHLGFIPNAGQWDREIQYVFVGRQYAVWVAKEAWFFVPLGDRVGPFPASEQGVRPILRLQLPVVPDTILPSQPGDGVVNFFLGKNPQRWATRLPHYQMLRCIAPGVEYHLLVRDGKVEYRLIVSSPEQLQRLRFTVAPPWQVRREEDGRLTVRYRSQPMFYHTPPRFFQKIHGRRVSVDGHFTLFSRAFGFAAGHLQPNAAVLVDPMVYSTFVGADSSDAGKAIVLDASGNAIVTGTTESSGFPTTTGAYDRTHNGGSDVFVFKLNAAGSTLIFATFIGGSEDDEAEAMVRDNSGNLYITGHTESSDFPTTSGAYDRTHNGEEDAFALKLNSSGSSLLYATYVGGSENDHGTGIAVAANGTAVVCGYTESSDFPTSNNAYDRTHNGDADAFVLRLNGSGSTLLYSTFLGGSEDDEAYDVALRGNGMAIVCGATKSSDFPTTSGAYDQSYNGSKDWFIAALNGSGTQLEFATFVGGSDSDEAYAIALGPSNSIVIAGATESSDFPTTSGAYDQSFNGDKDAAVVRMNASASQMLWGTFLGGSSEDAAKDCFVTNTAVYLTGVTYSSNFPVTSNAYDQSHNGEEDVFIAALAITGSTLPYATFVGGSSDEEGESIVASGCGVYVTGYTKSSNFPTTSGAYDQMYNGEQDAFVFKLGIGQTFTITASDQTICAGESVQLSVQPQPPGASYSWSPATGLSSTTVPNPTATPPSTITYTVTVTTPDGCSGSTSITITVSPAMALTTDDYTICAGDTVQLSASVSGGTTPYSYSWSPTIGLDDPHSATPKASPPSTVVYTVTVTDAAGCSTQGSVTVTVNPKPTIVLSDVEVCQGDTVEIGGEAQGGTAPYSYHWSPATGLDNPNVARPKAFPQVTTQYTVTVTDAAGCSVTAEVTVEVLPVPQVAIASDALDFGTLGECETDADSTIEITNVGDATVTLVAVELQSPHFAYTAPALPLQLDPGESVALHFRYSPQEAGSHSAVAILRFTPCDGQYELELQGEKTNVAVALSQSAVVFPSMPSCALQQMDTTVVIYNLGTAPIQIQPFTVPAPFQRISPATLPVTVDPGDSLVFVFRYAPTQAGTHTAHLQIPFYSANCTAALALDLTGSVRPVEVTASIDQVDFGELLGCEQSRDTVIVITNQGEMPVQIVGIASTNPAFQPDDAAGTVLQPGEQLHISVRFEPPSDGHFQGDVRITYEPCEGIITVPVEGSKAGVTFVAPDTVIFDAVVLCADSSITAAAVLYNFSGGAVMGRVTAVSVDPPFATSLQPGTTIAAGDSLEFMVVFQPTTAGHYTGELVVQLEPCGVEKRIVLIGDALDAGIAAVFDVIDMGDIAFGATTTATVAVVNTGQVPVTITAFAGLQPPFAVTDPVPPVTVAPADTLWITITLSGDVSGQFRDTLFVQSQQPCELVLPVEVYGSVAQRPAVGLAVCDRDFGAVLVGSTKEDTVCVRNTGQLRFRILKMEWVQNPDGVFQILGSPQGSEVLPSQQQYVWVRFSPTAAQDYQGVIRVEVDTTTGMQKGKAPSLQVLEALITVRGRGIAPLLQATGIDFGEVPIFHHGADSLLLVNKGSAPVTVTGVSWVGEVPQVFTVDTVAAFPRTLPPGSQYFLHLTFVPEQEQPYNGTLRILTAEGQTVEVLVSGVGVAAHTIAALPQQLVVEPKDKGVRIPVLLLSTMRDQRIFGMVAPATFTATVRWDQRLFYLQHLEGATLQNFQVGPNGIAEATITRRFETLGQDTLVLCEFVGDVLLGPADTARLVLSAYGWDDPAVLVQPQDGQMLLTNICTQGGKRLLDFKDLFGMEIAPNPSSAHGVEVTIYAVEKAASVFQVIAPNGQVVFEHHFAASEIPEAEPGKAARLHIRLPAILSSGVYLLRFRSPAREVVKTLVVLQ